LDNEEERKKLFSELKAELYKRQLSNAENFDKSILSYSTAGLGFSLAFLKDFLPITSALYGWLLYGSWIFFALAIIVTISSFISSQLGIKKQLSISERYYLKGEENAFSEKNFFALITDYLNNFSGLLFIAAIIFTTVFVSINLERASKMAEKKTVKTVPLHEGAPIPGLQKTTFAQDAAPVPTLQKIHQPGDLQKGAPIPGLQQLPQQPPQQQVQEAPAQSENTKGGDK
jgi:hypothetical protein